ncbi:hypothetical protein [Paenibacillus nasutitermitis]|nr:hypothetical protein [Paenibacillus nasutitermitis]
MTIVNYWKRAMVMVAKAMKLTGLQIELSATGSIGPVQSWVRV